MKSMFKFSSAIALSLIFTTTIADAAEKYDDYTLEQVVIFSRHGLRAPLATPSSALGQLTSHQWPQ